MLPVLQVIQEKLQLKTLIITCNMDLLNNPWIFEHFKHTEKIKFDIRKEYGTITNGKGLSDNFKELSNLKEITVNSPDDSTSLISPLSRLLASSKSLSSIILHLLFEDKDIVDSLGILSQVIKQLSLEN